MRRYAINSQYNMRDLGGYPTRGNGFLAWKQVIRSDCPVTLTDEDALLFDKLNISDVIDLRTPEQAMREPSYFSGSESIIYHNVSFINGNGSPKREESISSTYLEMMEEFSTINEILRIVSEARGAVLYHCAVGKDRTGIVTAIILSICGVSIVDIVADYQVSETYIYDMIAEYKRSNPSVPEWVGRSKPEYMRDCLNSLEQKYGSFKEYLKAMDVPERVINGIKDKLIQQ